MSAATDLQDRRRAAVAKVEERMIAALVADRSFEKLRVEDVKEAANMAKNFAWDAVVEVTS